MKSRLRARRARSGAALEPALVAGGHELVDLDEADAVIDFTRRTQSSANVVAALERGRPVRDRDDRLRREPVDERARERGLPVFFAPNFAIGAVLMMRFAAEAAALHAACRDHRAAQRGQEGRPVRDGEGDGAT